MQLPLFGGLLKSCQKQTQKKAFFHSYVPGICYTRYHTYVRAEIQPHLLVVHLIWGGVWRRSLVLSSTPVWLPLAHPE